MQKQVFLAKLEENFENRDQIQVQTSEQSKCNKWRDIRKNMVTASLFGKICKVRNTSSYHTIIKSAIYSTSSSASMSYGIESEKAAIEGLEQSLKIKIKNCGLFIDSEYHFLGASPDGLIGSDGICEVKCPFSAKDMTVLEAVESKKIKYLTFNPKKNLFELKKKMIIITIKYKGS